jgi:hypothetical protein
VNRNIVVFRIAAVGAFVSTCGNFFQDNFRKNTDLNYFFLYKMFDSVGAPCLLFLMPNRPVTGNIRNVMQFCFSLNFCKKASIGLFL